VDIINQSINLDFVKEAYVVKTAGDG